MVQTFEDDKVQLVLGTVTTSPNDGKWTFADIGMSLQEYLKDRVDRIDSLKKIYAKVPPPSPRFLVLGDAMTDCYLIGEANRLSPEAPVPVVKIQRTVLLPGGAANVAENLKALGAQTVLVSGQPFSYEDGADPDGFPIEWLEVIVKSRLMVGDTQLARWDRHDQLKPIARQELVAAKMYDGDFDGVLIADYGKGSITQVVFDAIESLFPTVPLYIDTKAPQPWMPKDATYFPNLAEFTAHQGFYDSCMSVVVKRGANGMEIRNRLPGEASVHIRALPAMARYARCVNGAGDTVIAAFAYAEATGIAEPLEFASAAAACVVEKPYTATASLGEVLGRWNRVAA
jgi:bifunctional ADP-heptose synthase (sugar kinase/adenylyltransferase)